VRKAQNQNVSSGGIMAICEISHKITKFRTVESFFASAGNHKILAHCLVYSMAKNVCYAINLGD
jgi:hypothetical protein